MPGGRAVDLAAPAGRVADLGGPQVLAVGELARAYLAATGRRKAVLRVPVPGKLAGGFRAGGHLLADGDRGTRTFEDYLRSRVGPDGSVASPYDLKAKRRAMFRPPAQSLPRPS